MIIKRFEWIDNHHPDAEFGEGWRPLFFGPRSGANTVHGAGAAHDCLEHFARDGLGAKSELKAMGSAIYIRGENTGWFIRANSVRRCYENIGFGIFEAVRNHVDNNEDIPTPKKFYRPRDSNLSEYIDKCVAEAKKNMNEEHANRVDEVDWCAVRHWVCVGHRQAIRRWSRIADVWSVESSFTRIRDIFDKIKGGYTGSILTIYIDVSRCDVTIRQDGYRYT